MNKFPLSLSFQKVTQTLGFTAYGQQEPLQCTGYFNASIRANNNVINVEVYVRAGNAESLLGRDSSFKLKVLTQVNSVDQTSNSELDSLLKEYSDMRVHNRFGEMRDLAYFGGDIRDKS